jgi:hypothetical protein
MSFRAPPGYRKRQEFATGIDLCAWCDLNTLLFIVDDQLDEEDVIKDHDAFFKMENNFLENGS